MSYTPDKVLSMHSEIIRAFPLVFMIPYWDPRQLLYFSPQRNRAYRSQRRTTPRLLGVSYPHTCLTSNNQYDGGIVGIPNIFMAGM